MIKAVLFDMDGCLFDSEYYYMTGTLDWMKKYGYTGSDSDVYQIIGTTMNQTYEILYHLMDGKLTLEEIIKINNDYFDIDHPLDCKKIMFDGVKEVIDELKKLGIKFALCSSSPKKTIVSNLIAMDIYDDFELITSSEDFSRPKPFPDIYLAAKDHLKLDNEECVVYEDSKLGIEAGVSAKIFTIARKDERYNQDQSHADLIVNDIKELLEYIKNNMVN